MTWIGGRKLKLVFKALDLCWKRVSRGLSLQIVLISSAIIRSSIACQIIKKMDHTNIWNHVKRRKLFIRHPKFLLNILTHNRNIFKECQRERKLHQSFLFVLFRRQLFRFFYLLPLIVHLVGSSLTCEEWENILLAFTW